MCTVEVRIRYRPYAPKKCCSYETVTYLGIAINMSKLNTRYVSNTAILCKGLC